MEIKFNPYAKKSHNDYGTYFNPLCYYVELYGSHPDVYEYRLPIKNTTFVKLDKMGAERVFLCESTARSRSSRTRSATGTMTRCSSSTAERAW